MHKKNFLKEVCVLLIIFVLISSSIVVSANMEARTKKETKSINPINSVNSGDDYGVELSCDDSYQNVKPGETATFVVEITNTGVLDDTYDITAGSIEDIICKVNGVNADQFDPYEITLANGESTTFEVTAEVWETVPEDEWGVIVTARSQSDTNVYESLTLTANVKSKNKQSEKLQFIQFLEILIERSLISFNNIQICSQYYDNYC